MGTGERRRCPAGSTAAATVGQPWAGAGARGMGRLGGPAGPRRQPWLPGPRAGLEAPPRRPSDSLAGARGWKRRRCDGYAATALPSAAGARGTRERRAQKERDPPPSGACSESSALPAPQPSAWTEPAPPPYAGPAPATLTRAACGGTWERLPVGPGGAAAQGARGMSQCGDSGAPRRRRCPAGSTAAATALGRRLHGMGETPAGPRRQPGLGGALARPGGASEWCPAGSAAAGPWQQPYSGGMPGRKRRRGDTDSLAGARGRKRRRGDGGAATVDSPALKAAAGAGARGTRERRAHRNPSVGIDRMDGFLAAYHQESDAERIYFVCADGRRSPAGEHASQTRKNAGNACALESFSGNR